MKTSEKIVAIVGLALGGVFGMAGTFVAQPNLRAIFWAIDGVGLIVATSLLALHYFRKDNNLVAAGFLVYAIGEGVMLGGTAGSLDASVPSFAAGTALWAAALILTSVPREFALWTRIIGIVGAILFAMTSIKIFWGEQLLPISRPLPYFAYPFLVLTFAGWIVSLLMAE
jgi:hypothetical protein